VITVGYVETVVSIFESAGVAHLTVAISAPNASVLTKLSFCYLWTRMMEQQRLQVCHQSWVDQVATALLVAGSTLIFWIPQYHTHFSATELLAIVT